MRSRITILIVLVVVFGGMAVLYQSGYVGGGGPAGGGEEPLDEDELVTAYVRLAGLAEQMPIGTAEYDKERVRLLDEIGITPDQVEQTLAYYNTRPDLWRPIWKKIQDELTSALDEAEAEEQDSADTIILQ